MIWGYLLVGILMCAAFFFIIPLIAALLYHIGIWNPPMTDSEYRSFIYVGEVFWFCVLIFIGLIAVGYATVFVYEVVA